MTALEEGNLVEMFGSGKNLFADFLKGKRPLQTQSVQKKLWVFFQEFLKLFNLSLESTGLQFVG